jgi:hypothetical protein
VACCRASLWPCDELLRLLCCGCRWLDGYRPRFGITYVDYSAGLQRYPKMSAWWLSQHFFKPGAGGAPHHHHEKSGASMEHQRDEI